MRILYITQWFSPIAGGGEVVNYSLAKEIANRGHKVEVASHRPDSDSGFDPINVDLYRTSFPLRHLSPPSNKEHSLFLINASLIHFRIIREERINLDAMELFYSDLCNKTLAVSRLADSQ